MDKPEYFVAAASQCLLTTKHEFFKEEFDRLAIDGYIGQTDGVPAFAYIRVSSDEQGEEGRSGLPRQIEHIHQKALEVGYRITWDRVFADDFTGFEFEGRPGLDRLRREYRNPHRRASIVVMEYLDRLSRNADWHQGFLLDEMKNARMEAAFWKAFGSRIERAVMGAVSQEGMEQALERMADGTRKKAESGRVTARRRNYGFNFVDENGNEGERARRHTYYAIREDEATVIRLIYQRIAQGDSMTQIAKDLDAAGVRTPQRTRHWEGTILPKLVRNPVYKGEFIAHRQTMIEVEVPTKDGFSMRRVKRRVERPESEWIRVPVPAIVSIELWQAANDMLAKNKAAASRNGRERYLLTGLVKCADCGYTYCGTTQRSTPGSRRERPVRCYQCRQTPTRTRRITVPNCHQRQIAANIIEPAVWNVVCNALLRPDVLIEALEADTFNEHQAQLERQIAYLEQELANKSSEDEKLYRAYLAGAFDEIEYAERRKLLKAESAKLSAELDKLYPQRTTREAFETQKALVLEFAEKLQSMNAHIDPPFEVKQKILKMTVDEIALNARAGWFRLEGVIRGTHAIVNSSARRGRARLRAAC